MENIIKQGFIIQKKCELKYSKIVPLDIENYSYIILISKDIYSHPSPLPNHILITIYSQLQELIYQADVDTMDVMPIRIITGNYLIYSYIKLNFYLFILFYLLGNLIKIYFRTDYLADVHASLNNADCL